MQANVFSPSPPDVSAIYNGTMAIISWTPPIGQKPTSYSIRSCYPCSNCTKTKLLDDISSKNLVYLIRLTTDVACYRISMRSCISDHCGIFSKAIFIKTVTAKGDLHTKFFT